MDNPRQIAAELLHELQHSKHTLDYLLDRADPVFHKLQKPDRSLAHALIFGVLRWQGRLDWIIGQLLRHPGKKLDPWVHIVLRLGLFQLFHLDRIPASAAVHTAVELAKKNNRKWAAGFVNGVLREAVRRSNALPLPDIAEDPVTGLAIRYAFPTWMIRRWIDRWGLDNAQSLCRAVNRIPPITIRTNTLKTTRANLIESLRDDVKSIAPTDHSPVGISCISPERALNQWPTYLNGWFQVQGEASQIIAYFLKPQAGQRVWDACAGLGTKSAHLAQLMNNEGHLLVSDQEPAKLAKLGLEMQRLAVTCAEIRNLDLEKPEQLKGMKPFDRILVDAPCSGLGVLQKNPDGKWRTSATDIESASRRQYTILSNASNYLRPGGTMVYAVCSFEPEENELLVHRFLQNHPEFVIRLPDVTSIANAKKMLTPEGFLLTLPHQNQMDGFFAVAFKRRAMP